MPGGALPEGTDQTRHRLEAFSDIVIALALSQLAFTLRLPDSSHELFAHPVPLLTFGASFVFICAVWWLHHQLFARLFIPDTVSVILNFAFLAAVVFVAYSLQLMSRFDDLPAIATYALSFGCAWALLAILYAKGLRDPRLPLDDAARRQATVRARNLAIAGLGLLASAVVAGLGRNLNEVVAIWIAIALVLVFFRVRDRIARRTSTASGET